MKNLLVIAFIFTGLLISQFCIAEEVKYNYDSKEFKFFEGVFSSCRSNDELCNQIDKELLEITNKVQKLYESSKFNELANLIDREVDLNYFNNFPSLKKFRKHYKEKIINALRSTKPNIANYNTWTDHLKVIKKLDLNTYRLELEELTGNDIGYRVFNNGTKEDIIIYSLLDEGDALYITSPYKIETIASVVKGSKLLSHIIFNLNKPEFFSIVDQWT